jgi:hypothetical protein
VKDSARAAFVPLTVAFEGGYIDWMFPDVKKLISTGFGLLLDPVALAIGLPWRHPDGRLASREEIHGEWLHLKNYVIDNPGSEFRSYKTFASRTTLRLGRDGLYQAFQGKMNQMLGVLRKGFPEWDSWPADAQLGTMSMSWACGPAFWMPSAGRNFWPKLTAALRSRDFRTAAVECFMNEEATNPGIIPRNRANRILYTNAAIADRHLDPETLFYPADLENADTPPETPTTPVLVPEARPDPLGHVAIVRPAVPLGRPALDGDLPTSEPDDGEDNGSGTGS